MYKVFFDKSLKKDLKKLDKPTLKLVLNWIENNLQNTRDPRLKGMALKGDKREYWRYRIADYRLIVKIEDDKLVILAINFKHRREVYR